MIVTGQDDRLGIWMAERQDGATWVQGSGFTIGLLDDVTQEILAVVAYESYNKVNIVGHIAAVPGRRWLDREFLWYCFYYPFVQLGCKRITGLVASNNLEARKFDENLGFTLEATLKDAHPEGDLLVYSMTKDQCRWLHLKERKHG